MLALDRLDKDSLREAFSKHPDEYFKVKLFEEQGYERHKCSACGRFFWSIGDRDRCDDPSHTEYSFFKDNPKPIGYVEFWKKFSGFFEKNGHAIVDRYPVVSRWRQDLYFTIASIQDFQRIENGAMSFEYSANPLLVPQICLRFSDIENVGVTGRHLTSFMMAGQHAFNYPKEGYWRDKTIELNFAFLTEMLGVKKENLIYNEDAWAMGDFSEFGPCLESFANGAELVNSVFTQFESVNGEIRELKGKVVDVGWGFDRLMWFYTGYDSALEAVFHDTIKRLGKKITFDTDSKLFKRFSTVASELDVTERGAKSKEMALLQKAGISLEDYESKIKPTQALYAVLDHARTLLFAITDGALPSNIGGGYNLRVILRRALSFIEEYNLNFDLNEVARLQAHELKELFPELSNSLDLFAKVVEIEERRFTNTRENASRIIEGILAKSKKLDAKELRTLYESNGVTPELIKATAAKKKLRIDMPESSYEDIMKGDFATKEKGKKIDIDVHGIEKTEQLYYKLADESSSKVLKSEKRYVILDRTPFYPEGGGQEADHGTINGFKVTDVQKLGNVIVHIMEEETTGKKELQKGATAKCEVDKGRRRRLMVHHTSTHLMSAAARHVLGKHAWQEGTKKEFHKAHIDIAHYDKLNDDEVRLLEDFVNGKLFNGINVTVREMDRKEAEGKYGFEIYQGHGVPAQKIRMVIIEDKDGNFIDAEACGGLHVTGMEQAIGMIKIIKTERISDGIDRIEFVAGNAALDQWRSIQQRTEAQLKENNWKLIEMRQQSAKMEERLLSGIVEEKEIGKESIIAQEYDLDKDTLRKLVLLFIQKHPDRMFELRNKNGDVICFRGPKLASTAPDASAVEHLKGKYGNSFKGGGNQQTAEGRIA
ncbi:MAG: alanine--tRNA ligase [Candidatus Micrarchaeota archaeon]|nr:alanine--tRNA ligase [Candidatus Micrarchaeota archaeon]